MAMNRGILRISPQLIVQFLEAISQGHTPRAFRVVKNGLPADTHYVSAFYNFRTDTVEIVVESQEQLPVSDDPTPYPGGYPYLALTELSVFYEHEIREIAKESADCPSDGTTPRQGSYVGGS